MDYLYIGRRGVYMSSGAMGGNPRPASAGPKAALTLRTARADGAGGHCS